jgi:hypothetical protein
LEKNISETNESFENKFGGNVHRMVLYKMNGYFLCRSEILEDCHPNDILKHSTLWENWLNLFCQQSWTSLNTNFKLYINSNWMFSCNIFICCVDLNSKMAATTMGTNIFKKIFFVTTEAF